MSPVEPGPTLSICIPAFNRPEHLRTALRSALSAPRALRSELEVVVSDDSTDPAVGEVWRQEHRAAGDDGVREGRSTYHHNAPALGMAANWNRCVDLAGGRYVLILHDDDFLLPGGPAAVVAALERHRHPPAVLLFGVDVVDAEGRRRRRQAFRRRRYLPPPVALARVLSRSSFVRFPAMVVARSAYESVAPFDEGVGEVADLVMWARLLAAYGLWLEPALPVAYRVHHGALTTGMWRAETLGAAARVFDDEAVRPLLRPAELRRLQGRWMSQFVLAGAWRRLEAGYPLGALEVLRLFDSPPMAGVAVPPPRRAGRRVLAAAARLRRPQPDPAGLHRAAPPGEGAPTITP